MLIVLIVSSTTAEMSQDTRNSDRDILRAVRDQASRFYLQTIAANERENRLLCKKLNALDMEHRAQYLKMKKWIQDAQARKKKKARKTESYRSSEEEKSVEKRSKKPTSKPKSDDATVETELVPPAVCGGRNEPAADSHSKLQVAKQKCDNSVPARRDKKPKLDVTKSDNYHLQQIPNLDKRRVSSLLIDRVKYTDGEIARLKTSFAGKKTPPHVKRFRKFLPHLEDRGGAVFNDTQRAKQHRHKGKQVIRAKHDGADGLEMVTDKLPQISIAVRKASSTRVIIKPGSSVKS